MPVTSSSVPHVSHCAAHLGRRSLFDDESAVMPSPAAFVGGGTTVVQPHQRLLGLYCIFIKSRRVVFMHKSSLVVC